MRAFVTDLNPGTHLKLMVWPEREPIWTAWWIENGEEDASSHYDLRVLLKNVLEMQEKGK